MRAEIRPLFFHLQRVQDLDAKCQQLQRELLTKEKFSAQIESLIPKTTEMFTVPPVLGSQTPQNEIRQAVEAMETIVVALKVRKSKLNFLCRIDIWKTVH